MVERSLSFLVTCNHQSVFCPYDFAFPRVSYKWTHTASSLSDLVLLLNLENTQVLVLTNSLFLFIAEYYYTVWMDHLYVGLPGEWHVGCFQFGAFISRATINIGMHGLWNRNLHFTWELFRNGITEFYGMSIFTSNEKHFPKWLYHFAFPWAIYESSSFFLFLSVVGVVTLLLLTFLKKCEDTIVYLTCISLMTVF